MNTDLQIPVLEQYPPFPPNISGLLAEFGTLIPRNAGHPPEQASGNKGQFMAALSPEPHKGTVKSMCLNISPSAKL
jgi:hypothetical protein